MRPLRATFTTRTGRRLAAVVAAAVLLPVTVAGLVFVHESSREVEAQARAGIGREAQLLAARFSSQLMRPATEAGIPRLELPAGDGSIRENAKVALIDSEGRVLFSGAALPEEIADLLGRYARSPDPATGAPVPLAWQAAGTEWNGALVRINQTNSGEARWSVVVFEPRPGWLAGAGPVAGLLALLLGLALLVIVIATLELAHRLAGPPAEFRRAFADAEPGRLPRIDVQGVDEFSEALLFYNVATHRVQERLAALETLGEIDRLLLGSAELEQMFDAILSRVQSVARCHGVAITLVDADSSSHGRVFFTGEEASRLPVMRVELDPSMLATLGESPQGMTIMRWEPSRHSLLRPLAELGAQYFWLWPVVVGDKVVAALSLGYREAPEADPALARYGAEFASRLSVALSNSARDEALYRQAHFDALTSLPNRLLFRDRLAQELATATAGHQRGALLYIDLDHFKRVNDSVGHAAGDQLLTIVAQRLRACVKDGDTVARLGGDEFTIVLRQVTDPGAVRAVAERIISTLELPVNVGGRDHLVHASIGMTLFPDDATHIDELMRNADSAMYRAKDTGRGRAMFFDRALAARQVSATGSGLYRALRDREFSLYYQPQYRLSDGKMVGVEALLRWQTPRSGMKYPGEFVPAAEECGLIVDIGAWVLDRACAQIASWRDQGFPVPRLSVNVSVQQLKAQHFREDLRRLLSRHGLVPSQLELEFNEAVLADADLPGVLGALSADGVRLALDDFGAAETSLTHLRTSPINTVKIDRTFIEGIPTDLTSSTLGATVIAMAHALGKTVVAEGVEAIEQIEFLREHGCDAAQGYYLARPMPASSITELLAGRESSSTQTAERLAG